ncbi:MAG: 4Fe-4S dicluster domain-containing protein, partial [Clostridia bacterium]|nr:4Fe-4S dicluster domain-containing protein [Clostridia bacterium]
LKGGALADPIPAVQEIFKEADPDASIVSWGIRYAAGLEGVMTVLSGMSSLEQMQENLSYMKDFQPLDEEEMKVIRRVQDALNADKSIPCTACHYCTDGCPMNIPIPEIIAVANRQRNNEDFRQKREYNIATTGRGKASDCIQCGQCEDACPQHLEIISYLADCAKEFEE